MSRFSDISDQQFSKVVSENYCIRDIVGALGYSPCSGSMAICVKERINKLGLDISHLKGRASKSSSNPHYSLEEILIRNSSYTNTKALKSRLVKAGLLEYECSKCKNTGNWQGETLVLQLEHINGIHSDNRLENLCFLCPNCHSQTKTYSGRNSGRYINIKYNGNKANRNSKVTSIKSKRICINCGQIISNSKNIKFCSKKCHSNYQRKTSLKPSKEILENLIKTDFFNSIAQKYGVNDASVRNWCKSYGLPHTKSAIREKYKIKTICEINKPSYDSLKELIFKFSFREIGRKYNVTDNAVRKWCKKYNLPHRKKDIKVILKS